MLILGRKGNLKNHYCEPSRAGEENPSSIFGRMVVNLPIAWEGSEELEFIGLSAEETDLCVAF